ncbi:MAG TPA: hypothetical protein PKY30_11375, partial [Myxococcota bacterium]|nr:hypothetical protein [Myxococcota bacterium]
MAHDKIHVAYVVDTSAWSTNATYTPIIRSLGSASEDLSSGDYVHGQASGDTMDWATQGGGVFDSGDLAMWADEDGALYLAGRDHKSGAIYFSDILVRRSYDQGQSWAEMGVGPSQANGAASYICYDDNTSPQAITVCALQGTALLVSTNRSSPASHDDSLACMYLGGYTTCSMPQHSRYTSSPDEVESWTHTWLPFDKPEDVGDGVPVWTASGAGSSVIGGRGLKLDTLSRTYSSTHISSSITEGLLAQAQLEVVSGTGLLDLRISDSTPLQYNVQAKVTTTSIALFDVLAGADIASASTTIAASGPIQIRLSLQDNVAKLYYRAVGVGMEREWSVLSGAPSQSASNPGMQIYYGQPTASTTYWQMVCFSDDEYCATGFSSGTTPGCGRGYAPTPVYVDDGLSIQVTDGPTYLGDSWTIATRYQYPVENVFPDQAPSPRRGWRSSAGGSQSIIFDLYSKDPTLLQGSLLGLYLGGIDFGTAQLYGQDAADAWQLIDTLTIKEDLGAFARVDDTIKPKLNSDHPGYYFPTNILANCHVKLDDGGGNISYRKIRTNSAGSWN